MTIAIQLEQIELPLFWAPALINHDLTSYTDDELVTLEQFIDDMIAKYGQCWCIDVGGDVWFSAHHSARAYGVLACDVAMFTFDVTKRGE